MLFGTNTTGVNYARGQAWQRVSAILVVFIFIFVDAVRYAPQGYASPVVAAADPAALSFLIPKELGKVDEVYFATTDYRPETTDSFSLGARGKSLQSPVSGLKSQKLVIFIQDAHDSLEAQENIAKLVGMLVKEKGIKTVFEEGYEGPVPTDKFFGSIKDPAIKQKVSYFLLDKLRVGGAEYAHINRTDDFKLVGVEDLKLYGENLLSYREASLSRKETAADLRELFTQVSTLADQYFPKELKTWLKTKERFSEGKLPLLNYLGELQAVFPGDRRAGSFFGKYPGISLLLAAQTARDPALVKQLNALDSRVVFSEILRAERDIAGAYLQNERDRRIFAYDQELSLLTRLNQIELTQPEYEAVKETLQKFETQKLADFIVSLTRRSLVLSKGWEQHIKDAVRFYDVARKRDVPIDRHLEDFLLNKEENTAILVFGGFHTSGIKEILREQGLSYVVIAPRITSVDKRHQDYYKQLMSVGHYSFETPFLAARANRAPGSFYLTATGQEPFVRAELRAITSSVEAGNSDTQLIERGLARFSPNQEIQPSKVESGTASVRSETRTTPSETVSVRSDRLKPEALAFLRIAVFVLRETFQNPVSVTPPGRGENLLKGIVPFLESGSVRSFYEKLAGHPDFHGLYGDWMARVKEIPGVMAKMLTEDRLTAFLNAHRDWAREVKRSKLDFGIPDFEGVDPVLDMAREICDGVLSAMGVPNAETSNFNTFLGTLIAPLREEIFYRYLLPQFLAREYGMTEDLAHETSGSAFADPHALGDPYYGIQMRKLAYVCERAARYMSLHAAIGVHAAINALIYAHDTWGFYEPEFEALLRFFKAAACQGFVIDMKVFADRIDFQRSEVRAVLSPLDSFRRRAPVLWQELIKTSDAKQDAVARTQYDLRLGKDIPALAKIFEKISLENPDDYLIDILRKSLSNDAVKGAPEWTGAILELKGLVDSLESPGLTQRLKRWWNRMFTGLAEPFPLGNLAYQALIEMVRQWPKKERHTHVSASMPAENIVKELNERRGGDLASPYAQDLNELVKAMIGDGKSERVASAVEFRKLLMAGKPIEVDEFRRTVDSRIHRGTRAVRDYWIDVIKDREIRRKAVLEAIRWVIIQNFADGVTDLELRFNPFKATEGQKELEDFLIGLTRECKLLENDAEKQNGKPFFVSFMFSFGREKMRREDSSDEDWLKKKASWESKFDLLSSLKLSPPEGLGPNRLAGIDIAGIEPFKSKYNLTILKLKIPLRDVILLVKSLQDGLNSFVEFLQRRFGWGLKRISFEWVKFDEDATKESVVGDFDLPWLYRNLKMLKVAGFDITMHLADFTGASPANEPEGHIAFIKAHLKVLEDLNKVGGGKVRMGHARMLTPGKLRLSGKNKLGNNWVEWQPGNKANTYLLSRARAQGITVESTPESDMLDMLTLRNNYPNYYWFEPEYRLNVVYGSDGYYGSQPITLSQWLVRLMLASPTPQHPSLGRKKGITVAQMRDAVKPDQNTVPASGTETPAEKKARAVELIRIFQDEGFFGRNVPDDQLAKQVIRALNPEVFLKAPEELVRQVALPGYISGPYRNGDIRDRPEWEGNRTYQIKLFGREMQKAIDKGMFKGDRDEAERRFIRLWDAFTEFEDTPGHVYYHDLTGVQNNRVSTQLIRYVLFRDPFYDNGPEWREIANRANEMARVALRGSLFTETLSKMENAKTDEERVRYLRRALLMALHASAPNVRFSDPGPQKDFEGTVRETRKFLSGSLDKSLALDAVDDISREVLTPRTSGQPLKVLYFVDDNGDLIYHLYLIQSFLAVNPGLEVTLVAKSERVAIDTKVSDVRNEIESREFSGLRTEFGRRFKLVEEGPVYGGVNLDNASRELVEALRDTDLVVGLGQMLTENMNGIRKPAYHQAYVDSKYHQRITGLPRGSLYFVRVPADKKYYDHYEDDARLLTLKDSVSSRYPEQTVSPQDVWEGRAVEAVLQELEAAAGVLDEEQKEAQLHGQKKVVDFVQIGLDEISSASQALEDYRSRGIPVGEKATAMIKTYAVFDTESEAFDLEKIPEFQTILHGGHLNLSRYASESLAPDTYRANHMRRAVTFFRALTSGNFDYYLRRLPAGESPEEFERGLRVFKSQYDLLSPEEKRMIWTEIKLHDIGFALSSAPVGHEARGALLSGDILERMKLLPIEQIAAICFLIERHTHIGWTYLGERRMKKLAREASDLQMRLLLLHNQADGPASGVGEMRMPARQVTTLASWFDPDEREKVAESFEAFRLLKTARPSMIAPDPGTEETARLESAAREIFGDESGMLKSQMRERLDVTEGSINVFYRLVSLDPSYREFAKFWKLLGHLAAIPKGDEVRIFSDISTPIPGILRDEAIAKRTEIIAQAVLKMPPDLTEEDVRRALNGLPDGAAAEFFGIPLRRAGSSILLETERVINSSAHPRRSETRGSIFDLKDLSVDEMLRATASSVPVLGAMAVSQLIERDLSASIALKASNELFRSEVRTREAKTQREQIESFHKKIDDAKKILAGNPQYKDLVVFLDGFSEFLLPLILLNEKRNPIHHAGYILITLLEIMSAEKASAEDVKVGMAAALLHDASLVRKSRPILTLGLAAAAEAAICRAIRQRYGHMRELKKSSALLLTGFNKVLGRASGIKAISRKEKEKIGELLSRHDLPTVAVLEARSNSETKGDSSGGVLFKEDDKLLMCFREALRLWMVSPEGIRTDVNRQGETRTPLEILRANIARHREEEELYEAAFKETAAQYGFQKRFLYRTRTGYAMFLRRIWECFEAYNIPFEERQSIEKEFDLDTPVSALHRGYYPLTLSTGLKPTDGQIETFKALAGNKLPEGFELSFMPILGTAHNAVEFNGKKIVLNEDLANLIPSGDLLKTNILETLLTDVFAQAKLYSEGLLYQEVWRARADYYKNHLSEFLKLADILAAGGYGAVDGPEASVLKSYLVAPNPESGGEHYWRFMRMNVPLSHEFIEGASKGGEPYFGKFQKYLRQGGNFKWPFETPYLTNWILTEEQVKRIHGSFVDSKEKIAKVNDALDGLPLDILIVIGVANEQNRLNPYSHGNPTGEDALVQKVKQLHELFDGTNIRWRLLFVSRDGVKTDGEKAEGVKPDISGSVIEKIKNDPARMTPEDSSRVEVLSPTDLYKESKKGAQIVVGLKNAVTEEKSWSSEGAKGIEVRKPDIVFYTDCDLTVDLRAALGNFIDDLVFDGGEFKVKKPGLQRDHVVVGSRYSIYEGGKNTRPLYDVDTLEDDAIPGGVSPLPDDLADRFKVFSREKISRPFLYPRVTVEGLMDTQAGMKGFSRATLEKIFTEETRDYPFGARFAFDTELLTLALMAGASVHEMAIPWSDSAAESQVSKPLSRFEYLKDWLTQYENLCRLFSVKHPATIDSTDLEWLKATTDLLIDLARKEKDFSGVLEALQEQMDKEWPRKYLSAVLRMNLSGRDRTAAAQRSQNLQKYFPDIYRNLRAVNPVAQQHFNLIAEKPASDGDVPVAYFNFISRVVVIDEGLAILAPDYDKEPAKREQFSVFLEDLVSQAAGLPSVYARSRNLERYGKDAVRRKAIVSYLDANQNYFETYQGAFYPENNPDSALLGGQYYQRLRSEVRYLPKVFTESIERISKEALPIAFRAENDRRVYAKKTPRGDNYSGELKREVNSQNEKAGRILAEMFKRLGDAGHKDLVRTLQDLYLLALPYYVKGQDVSPVHHIAHVMNFMSRILLGEADVSPQMIRRGMVAALLHDIGNGDTLLRKIRSTEVKGNPSLRPEAIAFREEHVDEGLLIIGAILGDYIAAHPGFFEKGDFEEIEKIISRHDKPTTAELQKELKETPTPENLISSDENDRLLSYHREADRLWMLTEDGIAVDLKGKAAEERLAQICNNIGRHHDEFDTYVEAKVDLKEYGFKGGTLYRSQTSYDIFKEQVEMLLLSPKPLLEDEGSNASESRYRLNQTALLKDVPWAILDLQKRRGDEVGAIIVNGRDQFRIKDLKTEDLKEKKLQSGDQVTILFTVRSEVRFAEEYLQEKIFSIHSPEEIDLKNGFRSQWPLTDKKGNKLPGDPIMTRSEHMILEARAADALFAGNFEEFEALGTQSGFENQAMFRGLAQNLQSMSERGKDIFALAHAYHDVGYVEETDNHYERGAAIVQAVFEKEKKTLVGQAVAKAALAHADLWEIANGNPSRARFLKGDQSLREWSEELVREGLLSTEDRTTFLSEWLWVLQSISIADVQASGDRHWTGRSLELFRLGLEKAVVELFDLSAEPEISAIREKISSADVVVLVPFFNEIPEVASLPGTNGQTIDVRELVKTVGGALPGILKRHGLKQALVLCVGETKGQGRAATEALKDFVRKMVPENGGSVDFEVFGKNERFAGLVGKKWAARLGMKVARQLGAHFVLIDGDMQIDEGWLARFMEPVLEGRVDYVSPDYDRSYGMDDIPIIDHVVFPLFLSLFGVPVRMPNAGEFVASKGMIAGYLDEEAIWTHRWPYESQFAAFALKEKGKAAANVWMGEKVHKRAPVEGNLRDYLEAALEIFSQEMKDHPDWWRNPSVSEKAVAFTDSIRPTDRKSLPADTLYSDLGSRNGVVTGIDRSAWMRAFKEEYPAVRDWYRDNFPETGVTLERLLIASDEAFEFSSEDWAAFVIQFMQRYAAAEDRAAYLTAFVPVFRARVASFVKETEGKTLSEAEALLRQEAQAFVSAKPTVFGGDILKHLLSTPAATDLLNETWLDANIPRWSRLKIMLQWGVHRNMVAEHIAGTLRELPKEEIFKPMDPRQREEVLLTLFFHDFGKNLKFMVLRDDHNLAGMKIVRPILKNLGLSEAEVEKYAWYVKHHDVLFRLAYEGRLKENIDDETLESFVARLTDFDCDLLTLLFLADMGEAFDGNPAPENRVRILEVSARLKALAAKVKGIADASERQEAVRDFQDYLAASRIPFNRKAQETPKAPVSTLQRLNNLYALIAGEHGLAGLLDPEDLDELEAVALAEGGEALFSEFKRNWLVYTAVSRAEARGDLKPPADPRGAQAPVYPTVVEVYEPGAELALLVNPKPNGRLGMTAIDKKFQWKGKIFPFAFDAESPKGKPKINLTWDELEKKIPLKMRKGTTHVYSFHNLYYVDWFVAFNGAKGTLYRRWKEDFKHRTYSMFVVWNDKSRKPSSEDLTFTSISDESPGQVAVYRKSDVEKKEDLSKEIKFAIFGQRIIRQGEAVPLEDYAIEFGDIYQLYRFPQFIRQDNGKVTYGLALGAGEMDEWQGKAPEKFREVVREGGLMEIDLSQYFNRPPFKEAAIPDSGGAFLSLMHEEAFRAHGYREVAWPGDPKSLKTGEYAIQGTRLVMKLKPYPYPHNLIGITRSGRVVAFVFTGDKMKGLGIPAQELAGKCRAAYAEKYPDAANDPLEAVHLLASSKDAVQRTVKNGMGSLTAESANYYTRITAGIAIAAGEKEPQPRASISSSKKSRSEARTAPLSRDAILGMVQQSLGKQDPQLIEEIARRLVQLADQWNIVLTEDELRDLAGKYAAYLSRTEVVTENNDQNVSNSLNQTTFARDEGITFAGTGWNTGRPVSAIVKPAPADTGIVFVRTDLKGSPQIPAVYPYARGEDKTVILERNGVRVATTEHIMAVLGILGIDNAFIELSGEEVPILDGGTLPYFLLQSRKRELVRDQGVPKLPAQTLDAPVIFTKPNENGIVLALPDPAVKGVKVTYGIDFGNDNPVGAQAVTLPVNTDNFWNVLAFARTFVVEAPDSGSLSGRKTPAGLVDNVTGVYVPRDRKTDFSRLIRRDAFALHKAVDLFGDIQLLGARLTGVHLVAIEAGHADHIHFARKLDGALKGLNLPYDNRDIGRALYKVIEFQSHIPEAAFQEIRASLEKLKKPDLSKAGSQLRVAEAPAASVERALVKIQEKVRQSTDEGFLRIHFLEKNMFYETRRDFDFLPGVAGERIPDFIKTNSILSLTISSDAGPANIRRVLELIASDDLKGLLSLVSESSTGIGFEVFSQADRDLVSGKSGVPEANFRVWQEQVKAKVAGKNTVTISMHQPGYHRYIGFFEKMRQSDTFSFSDDKQFVGRDWQHRQEVPKPDGRKEWLTVPLLDSGKIEPIAAKRVFNETGRNHWAAKHWKSFQDAYGAYPFFNQYGPFFKTLYERKWESLSALNEAMTRYMAKQLGIHDTQLIRSSVLGNDLSFRKGKALAAEVTKISAGIMTSPEQERIYLSGGGAHYLDELSGDGVTIEKDLILREGIGVAYHSVDGKQVRANTGMDPYQSAAAFLFKFGPDVQNVLEEGLAVPENAENKTPVLLLEPLEDGGTDNGERHADKSVTGDRSEEKNAAKENRSELRGAVNPEVAKSGDRADRMVRSIRQNAQPATVFVDAEDFPNLSLAQKQEYLLVALSRAELRVVVYNERGQVQDKELEALLRLDHVTSTGKDLAGAQIRFDRPNTPGIHLSKKLLPSRELVRRLKGKVSFFKTRGQMGGTLAAALLWAWSGGEEARLREISLGRDGFWIVAETLVSVLQKSYDATLAFAVAA